MAKSSKQRIEFGDWQTPQSLADAVCFKLLDMGIRPDAILEPTCGIGAFVHAAAKTFPNAPDIFGYEVNKEYLSELNDQVQGVRDRIHLEHADFFTTAWKSRIQGMKGSLLVLGNLPWVTNSTQGRISGSNMPEKSNFLRHKGFDAISGKANFDISESMMIEVLRWFRERDGDIAMLIKTATARKVLAHAQRQNMAMNGAYIIHFDAKKEFNAAVDACLLVMRMDRAARGKGHAYNELPNMDATRGSHVGYRMGIPVKDLDTFDLHSELLGHSPLKWRSGVKHDASGVMEFTRTEGGFLNGNGETASLESDFMFPLLKGSDIGSDKAWRNKFMLVTQRRVGEPTEPIQQQAPLTWAYLQRHSQELDARGSTIYAKNPRFSVFGIGDYAFRPWRIAICALYKKLNFRLIGPIEDRPVMFDDTVYYISFNSEAEAQAVLKKLNTEEALGFLEALIFWDEKRPIKASILKLLDWSKIGGPLHGAIPESLDLFSTTT